MPLFTILMGILLIQMVLSTSLFWERKGGRILLLHVMVQMLCWSFFKRVGEPSTLFTFGFEQTAFWINVLLGLVWVDWSVQARAIKILFAFIISLSALSALSDLFMVEAPMIIGGAQIACQVSIAGMLAKTLHKHEDISLSAFLGGWLGLLVIHIWTMVSVLWSGAEVDLSSQLIGAFIVSLAASCRLIWLEMVERTDELEQLREEIAARDQDLLLKQQDLSELSNRLEALQKDLRSLSRDLNRSQSELYQQAKTTSLGQSSIQINQQLQGILVGGMNRLRRLIVGLEDNGHKDSAVCHQLHLIFNSLDQASHLTSSLHKFGNPHKEGPESLLHVQTWLQEVLVLCEQRLKKSEIVLDIKDETGNVWVKGRVADLMHALMILVNNACEALEYSDVKRITIELKQVVHDHQDWLKVIISDTGLGIATNIRERIFQPFFSTKHLGQGSGLGLTIASRIFADHGGGIQLDAEALATTFVVQLPLQIEAPAMNKPLSS